MTLRIFLIVAAMMFSGCTSHPKIVEKWPPVMPPVHIFLQEYESDTENQAEQSLEAYLTWVKRFYQGWVVYERGWLKMSNDLAVSIDNEADLLLAEQKIHRIGLLIASEWAKEKDSRYIKTSDVSAWGESLLESISRGSILELMDLVIQDIDLLRQGQINSADIRIERYFPDMEEEEGGFFF